jgi:hypothetical protein
MGLGQLSQRTRPSSSLSTPKGIKQPINCFRDKVPVGRIEGEYTPRARQFCPSNIARLLPSVIIILTLLFYRGKDLTYAAREGRLGASNST